MRPRVSLAIITLDEAHVLERCIGSCRGLVDEVVVVDSGSTDGTQDIARRLGARVVHHAFDSFGAQKNRAVDLCTGDWVLNLDADEWLSDRLRSQVQDAVAAAPEWCAGWEFPRHNRICGRWPRFGGWRERRKFRLWRRGSVRWAGSVHEWGEVTGPLRIARLTGPLLHDMGASWERFAGTQRSYADRQAAQMHARGRDAGPLAPAAHAAWAWLRCAVLQLGVLEGGLGLRTAAVRAGYAYRKWARLRTLGGSRTTRSAAAGAVFGVLLAAPGGDDPRPSPMVREGGAVNAVRSCGFVAGTGNLLPNSRAFPADPWRSIGEGTGGAPSTERTGVPAPDGSDGAVTVRFDAGEAGESVLEATFPVVGGQDYTFAFSVRAPAGTFIHCRGVSLQGYTRIACDGGWQRVSITENSGRRRRGTVRLGLVSGADAPPGGQQAASIDLWGPHAQAGRSVPVYVPTGPLGATGAAEAARALYPMHFLAPGQLREPCGPDGRSVAAAAPEPAGTNLLSWSMDLGKPPWRREGIARVNAWNMPSPVGLPGADGIVEDGSVGPHGVGQDFECAHAGDHVASVFVHAQARKHCVLEVSVPGAITSAQLDLAGGRAERLAGSGEIAFEPIGQGWFRASVSARALAPGPARMRVLTLQGPGGSVDHAGDGKSGIAAWGAQAETGTRPTSYVPTFFVPETRSAEAAAAASR